MGKTRRKKQATARTQQRARERAAEVSALPDYALRGTIFAGRTSYTNDMLARVAKLSLGENAAKAYTAIAAVFGLMGLQLVQGEAGLPSVLMGLASLVICLVLFALTTVAPPIAAWLQGRRLDRAAKDASAPARDYHFYVTKKEIGIVRPDGEEVRRPLGDFVSYATDDVLYALVPRGAGGATSSRHILSWGLDPTRGVVALPLDDMDYGIPADLAAFVREQVGQKVQ